MSWWRCSLFICDKCGKCCKNLDRNALYSDLDRGDGVCYYLTSENLCSIYENRPDKCNIDIAYKKYFADTYTLADFYSMNYDACAYLKAQKNDKEV